MAITVDNVRIDDCIEQGATGGPTFSTGLLTSDNGVESAIENWTQARRFWDISYGLRTKAMYDITLAFFLARRGKARGFLFKDWTDYQMPRQSIGTGDGTTTAFALAKTYADTVIPYNRVITRPVRTPTDTLEAWVNGVSTGAFTYVQGSGIITFSVAPPNGQDVEAACEFDVPVRFDTDQLPMNITWQEAVAMQNILIAEIREP
jgi:uncharacterized protein (TIGR02217 family)